MPSLPNENTKTGTYNSVTETRYVIFNPALPVVHRLSGNLLQANGWERKGTTYFKGKDEIRYDGLHWVLNDDRRIEFYEDINNTNE